MLLVSLCRRALDAPILLNFFLPCWQNRFSTIVLFSKLLKQSIYLYLLSLEQICTKTKPTFEICCCTLIALTTTGATAKRIKN